MSKYGVISGPYFPVFGPNTEKYGPEVTPCLDTFHAVRVISIMWALSVTRVIIRLIVIDIAPITVLLGNCRLFCNYLLLKDISFSRKSLLVWCD